MAHRKLSDIVVQSDDFGKEQQQAGETSRKE
jgi:hypothetical protein